MIDQRCLFETFVNAPYNYYYT